ncbi:MAG: glycosyltransferase [Bacteroidaceae bacterium]|nr:glycosyltransferase [Bacteroidaceae bacterium]
MNFSSFINCIDPDNYSSSLIYVTIAVVSYNVEKYIEEAIDGIFMQRVQPNIKISILIADDCSTDKTIEIIKRKENESPWPFYYLQNAHNLGITRNYRRIFEFCDCDFIAIIEGDDIWCSPYHLQQHLSLLDSHHEITLSINSFIPFRKQDSNIEFFSPSRPYQNAIKIITLDEMLEHNYVGNFSSCVLRCSAVKKIDTRIWTLDIPNVDDWLIGIEMSRYGIVACISEISTLYRLNPTAFYSVKSDKEKWKEIYRRYHIYHEYLGGKYLERGLLAEKEQWRKDNWSLARQSLFILSKRIKHFFIRVVSFFLSPKTKTKIKKRIFNR